MSLANLINPDDFVSLSHKMVVYNLTSLTEILVPELFQLTCLSTHNFSFRGPTRLGARGHSLEILVFSDQVERSQYTKLTLATEKELLVLKGKVENVFTAENREFSDFDIKLESYDVKQYAQFVEAYQERQDRLNGILDKCKNG